MAIAVILIARTTGEKCGEVNTWYVWEASGVEVGQRANDVDGAVDSTLRLIAPDASDRQTAATRL